MEIESLGYKNCKKLIEIMKSFGDIEFTELDIKFLISKHIGYSKLSQERYFHALLAFNFIKKLENGNYGIV